MIKVLNDLGLSKAVNLVNKANSTESLNILTIENGLFKDLNIENLYDLILY